MTAQLPDFIYFEGIRYELYSNPLESYWPHYNKQRPDFCILETCRRGYVATWEIMNDKLLLKSIDGNYKRPNIFFGSKIKEYTIKSLFPKAHARSVEAIWFSGKLRLPAGKMTLFEDRGYESRFEREIILSIDKGNLIKNVMLDYTRKELIINTPEA